MPRYHINKDGVPRVCNAKISCPIGGQHFDTIEDAKLGYEEDMSDQMFSPARRSRHLQGRLEARNKRIEAQNSLAVIEKPQNEVAVAEPRGFAAWFRKIFHITPSLKVYTEAGNFILASPADDQKIVFDRSNVKVMKMDENFDYGTDYSSANYSNPEDIVERSEDYVLAQETLRANIKKLNEEKLERQRKAEEAFVSQYPVDVENDIKIVSGSIVIPHARIVSNFDFEITAINTDNDEMIKIRKDAIDEGKIKVITQVQVAAENVRRQHELEEKEHKQWETEKQIKESDKIRKDFLKNLGENYFPIPPRDSSEMESRANYDFKVIQKRKYDSDDFPETALINYATAREYVVAANLYRNADFHFDDFPEVPDAVLKNGAKKPGDIWRKAEQLQLTEISGIKSFDYLEKKIVKDNSDQIIRDQVVALEKDMFGDKAITSYEDYQKAKEEQKRKNFAQTEARRTKARERAREKAKQKRDAEKMLREDVEYA